MKKYIGLISVLVLMVAVSGCTQTSEGWTEFLVIFEEDVTDSEAASIISSYGHDFELQCSQAHSSGGVFGIVNISKNLKAGFTSNLQGNPKIKFYASVFSFSQPPSLIDEEKHYVTSIARQNLIESLGNGRVVGIAAPAITTWQKGETGSFELGISSDYPIQENTYYTNIYLEAIGGALSGEDVMSYFDEANSWLIFCRVVNIPAGDTITTPIIIEIPNNALDGIYQFKVCVCEEDEPDGCHSASDSLDYELSQSLYGSDQFALEIEE